MYNSPYIFRNFSLHSIKILLLLKKKKKKKREGETTKASSNATSFPCQINARARTTFTNDSAIVSRTGVGGAWNATEEIVTPNNDTTYNIENLQPFTVYSFRVSAVNAMGRSKPSEETFHSVTLRERTFFFKFLRFKINLPSYVYINHIRYFFPLSSYNQFL